MGALSAYLKEQGHQVEALHLAREADLRRLEGRLRRFDPQVVGVSAVTCEVPVIRRAVRRVRAVLPEVPLLVGGIHAIVAPESVLQIAGVDGVCCGEGELALSEYLRRLEAGEDVSATPNFVFRRHDELVRNAPLGFIEDLDSLPMLDRSVADMQQVIDANNGVLNVIFSRGCPWHCRFCCNRDIRARGDGTYARLHSVERATEELGQLQRRYRFKHVLFRDDTFTWNRQWALDFLDAYRQRFDHHFDIFSRVDCLDDELLEALAGAGCKHIFIGLDSGNDFIRNEVLHKEQDNEDLFRVADRMKALGITPMLSNIVGLPHETPEMFADTIEINRRIHSDMVVFSPTCGACPKIWVFTPWPGSELHHLCQEQGWLEPEPGARKVYRESALRMPGFPPEEIDRQFRRFRYNVYRPNFPLHALLYLIYDSRAFQSLFERIPLGLIGAVRASVLRVIKGVTWCRGAELAIQSKQRRLTPNQPPSACDAASRKNRKINKLDVLGSRWQSAIVNQCVPPTTVSLSPPRTSSCAASGSAPPTSPRWRRPAAARCRCAKDPARETRSGAGARRRAPPD